MKKPRKRQNTPGKKADLGQYIVAAPAICHGGVTFKGTRVFVSDVLADVERGFPGILLERWGNGKITKAALSEAVQLARTALLRDDGTLAKSVLSDAA